MKPPADWSRRHPGWTRYAAAGLILAAAPAVSRAEFIAGLDGVSLASTFETANIVALPQAGWSTVTGAARIFDLAGSFNGTIIATTAFGAYTVQYTPPQAVALAPNTR